MLSMASMSSNRVMIWNERDMSHPRDALRRQAGDVAAIQQIEPRSGAYRPESTLKQVVLPAPLGPMMP